MDNLDEVLRRLKEHGVTIKQEKCSFFNEWVEYFGRVIDIKEIHTSGTKLQAVLHTSALANI